MKTHTHLRWNVLFLVSLLAIGLTVHASRSLAAVKASSSAKTTTTKVVTVKKAALESIPKKQVKRKPSLEKKQGVDSKIRTCGETGICKTTEKRVILKSDSSGKILSSYLQGCRSMKWLAGEVVLKCPSDALIPTARTERVFRMQDIFSNGQINATAVQQQMFIKGDGVKVAVLDTGVDDRHPELNARILATASFVTDSTTGDVVGHGTHVSGIIAGQGVSTLTDTNGTNRALGVSPDANIIVGKICNDEGYCAEGDISAGIEWAVAQGAKVINLSLGGGAFQNHCDSDPLAQKVNWAVDQGVVVVAASGNGAETTPGVATPACASKAIAVGAVDQMGVRPVWSGYGNALDLVAPGLSILSPIPCAVAGSCPEAGYGWWSGTSMATPSVAGAAVLVRSANPALSAQEVSDILRQTAWDLGNSGYDPLYGYGRVNAYPAVRAALDRDSDGSLIPDDCNDHDAGVRPGAPELCDGVDNNCNGATDEGCTPASSSASSVSSASSSSSSRSSSASSRQSTSSSATAYCGDGTLDQGEACEFGYDCSSGEYCDADCQCIFDDTSSSSQESSASSAQPVCGNGLMEEGEQCEIGYACLSGQQCNGACHCINSSSSSSSVQPPSQCDGLLRTHQNRKNEYFNKLKSPAEKCEFNKQDKLWSLYNEIKFLSNLHLQYCGSPLFIPSPPPSCSSSSSSSNWCNEHREEFIGMKQEYLRWIGGETSVTSVANKYCQLSEEIKEEVRELWSRMNALAIKPQSQNCGYVLPQKFPAFCSSSSSSSRSSQSNSCGNGLLDSGEMCDDGNTMNEDGCTSACRVETGWNCTMNRTPICTTVCGDGSRASIEQCDDGDNANNDGCSSLCSIENGWTCSGSPSACRPNCGDGIITGTEQCDDRNTQGGDGCSSFCIVEIGWTCSGSPSACRPNCGDGLKTGQEQCDDGNTWNSDGCSALCAQETGWICSGSPGVCATLCGDGRIVGNEQCDDGNVRGGDGCSANCAAESGWTCTGTPSACWTTCGDGLRMGPEQCDDGNTWNSDGCSALCAQETGWICSGSPGICATLCGDGRIVGNEQCDDGNARGGDGCSSNCAAESGWTCTGNPSACRTACGDGIRAGYEECDDGNPVNTDGCSTSCTIISLSSSSSPPSSFCGNGSLNPGEQCDDRNNRDYDGCSSLCTTESGFTCSGNPSVCRSTCGDGFLASSEQCDDGNMANGDGCSASCYVQYGWRCTGSPSRCSKISSSARD